MSFMSCPGGLRGKQVIAIVIVQGVPLQRAPEGLSPRETDLFGQMAASPRRFVYSSISELVFELGSRITIADMARELHDSGVQFATYRDSRCNPAYWTRDGRGGFRLNPNVAPAAAIRDIYANGRAYAFECATAILVVLYRSVLERIGERAFNQWFGGLYLYDWQYDSDLRLVEGRDPSTAVIGDVLYFKNPDVNPATPEWQGENVIKLGDDLYYGHGIGIRNGTDIIRALNRNRRPGSTESAYLMDLVVYPDFRYWRSLINARREQRETGGGNIGGGRQGASRGAQLILSRGIAGTGDLKTPRGTSADAHLDPIGDTAREDFRRSQMGKPAGSHGMSRTGEARGKSAPFGAGTGRRWMARIGSQEYWLKQVSDR